MEAVVKQRHMEVVLPTYNGACYLEAQVASIHSQTIRPEKLLIRDDNSSDSTPRLLKRLQNHYGEWIEVLPSEGNLGCAQNINLLLGATEANYIALADQDDIWLPGKLEQSLGVMRLLEERHGATMPLLVHSDLELIDATGKRLGCNYLQRQRLDPSRTAPMDLALTNVVTGCTVLVNRALLTRALPIPGEALMHDWWLALVASVFGRIEMVENPTVLYRQHDRNVLGARGLGIEYILQRLKNLLADPGAGGHTRAAVEQAKMFAERYDLEISALPSLLDLKRYQRWQALIRLPSSVRPSKHGPLRTIGLYALLAGLPRSNSTSFFQENSR
jgi:glycosyltransferase involved in cell wall biosynthesis